MAIYHVTKIIRAPIKYVYDWATDYREDDNSIWGGKYPEVILLKTREKAVGAYYRDGSDGKPKLGVRVVTFSPSTCSWHLDYYGEEDTETGEYTLTSLGRMKTRLDIVLTISWKRRKGPSVKELEDLTNHVWVKYGEALEMDYASGKEAIG